MRSRLLVLVIIIAFGACKRKATSPTTTTANIPADSANRMIQSYLNSIGYDTNTTALHSIIVDAEALRNYLNNIPASNSIVGVKLMFAHNLTYINSGNSGLPAGYNRNALTVVIAGFDAEGDYVYIPELNVLDYNSPCPNVCPPGDAGSPLLVY